MTCSCGRTVRVWPGWTLRAFSDWAERRRGPLAVEEALARERLPHLAYDVGVVDVAGDGHDHVAGRVVAAVEAVDLRARHRGDRRLGAGDRPTERGVAPCLVGEEVVDDVVGVVVVHRDLVEDHVALGLDVGLGDRRGGHHVAQHVDRGGEVLVEDPRVEDGVLLGGEGVELPAHRVERDRDLHRGPLGGALEEQVLEEVRAAVQGRGLVARPDVDPHADAGRAGAGHLLGDDPQAAGQDRASYARGHRPFGVLDGVEGAGGAVLLHGGPSGCCTGVAPRPAPGWNATTGRRRPPAGRGGVERQVTRRRWPRPRPTPRSRPRPRRRRGPATACRGRRSRRWRPGPSGRPRGRPRRPRRACRRRGRAAC